LRKVVLYYRHYKVCFTQEVKLPENVCRS
jgi:hypothetical protein